MGGRGSGGTRNSNTSPIKLGESVTQLEKYTSWNEGGKNIRKDFGLDRATESQIESLRHLFQGILQYDKGYDDAKTPYNIVDIQIKPVSGQSPEELARNKELFGKTMEIKDLHVIIQTEPNDDRALIRMWDTKYRQAVLGSRGGYYTYNDKHKRVNIDTFKMHYGSTDITHM